jgi:glycosyltransferase involved in cell wall biosynthesis
MPQLTLDILIPCLNEERTIGHVITGFKAEFPEAQIIVGDNGSSDQTRQVAESMGARVIPIPVRGKGYAVRELFNSSKADLVALVDGDLTYDPKTLHEMITFQLDGFDMVVATRISSDQNSFRFGHKMGNRVIAGLTCRILRLEKFDVLSGYRLFSKRFVKSLPVRTTGFAIESEINLHASILQIPIKAVTSLYHPRPINSFSKLNKWRDGIQILWFLSKLVIEFRPNQIFIGPSLLFFLIGSLLMVQPVNQFLDFGMVEKFPSLFTGVILVSLGIGFFGLGFIAKLTRRIKIEQRQHFFNFYSSSNG